MLKKIDREVERELARLSHEEHNKEREHLSDLPPPTDVEMATPTEHQNGDPGKDKAAEETERAQRAREEEELEKSINEFAHMADLVMTEDMIDPNTKSIIIA